LACPVALAALALTTLPAAALAQTDAPRPQPAAQRAAPAGQHAGGGAWRSVRQKAPPPRLTVAIHRRPAEQRIAEAPIRPRPEWFESEGFRFTGTKVGYSRHF
jgi:hypothetical protein